MNENENNFESLRRLLAFKNRETPPPGYFNNFSGQVVARIRAGEANAPSSASERLFSEAPWLLKLLQAFEFKPAFAGAFASALCLVLVFGIVYAERPDAAPQPLLTSSTQVAPLAMASPTDFIPPAGSSGLVASSNSVLNLGSVASLFNQPNQNQLAQQVSFTIPGN
jgi:hypothetical protein